MSSELTEKIYTPCRGGIPPMALDEAKRFLEQTPDWTLVSDGKRIERTFRFGNFKEALELVDRIGALAEAEGHHPDIRFGWAYCTVELYPTRSTAYTRTTSSWQPRSISWPTHIGARLNDQCSGVDS